LNRYYCPSGRTSAHAVFPGDPVKLEANASAIGCPTVDLADATTDVPIGIVVAVEFLETNLNQLYTPVGISSYLLVADATDLVFLAQANGTVEDGDIGANVDIVADAAGDTDTQRSTVVLNISTANDTSTLKYKILRVYEKEGNTIGAYAVLEMTYNIHQLGLGAGNAGVHA